VLRQLGVSEAELAAAPGRKEELVAATQLAVEAGVFGVPAFRVDGGALIWGQDRLDQVERSCRGEPIDG
jgi:2-hydroxychromene-2-carboxylate isomerase